MRIIVLGDSSSAGIGSPQEVYPALLHQRLGGRHRVENHAVPGFTSADASRYYLRAQARAPWDVLVVYLGNNEGARSRYKGTYRRLRDFGRAAGARSAFHARTVDRLEFDSADHAAAVATTPRDFQRNLITLIREAARRGTRVILVNPVANSAFPAAMMGPNAPFFRIAGLHTRLAHRLVGDSPVSQALVEAITLHERGDLAAAAAGYRSLADGHDPVATVALNNLAVLLDDQGSGAEPIDILEHLASDDRAACSVAAYNLGRILARCGRHDQAQAWTALAAERDTDLYRIKAAYRDQVSALSIQAEVLDLAGLLGPADFVDYCHPTAAGHAAIASALVERLTRASGVDGREPDAGYVCVQPNPDAFFDFRSTVVDHYGIDAGVDRASILGEAAVLLDRVPEPDSADPLLEDIHWPEPDSPLQADVLATFRHAVQHPMITALDDLAVRPPSHGCEIGSFPEFYVYRLLRDYPAFAERWGIDELPDGAGRWHLGSRIHQQRTLSRDPVDEPAEPRITREYGDRVLRRVRVQLARSTDLFEDVRADRVLTIRWWYSREAFRYGTHSRTSMLYPLWTLEKLVEGLYVCLIIARRTRDHDGEQAVTALLAKLARLREVHERHAARFLAEELRGEGDDYRAELVAARDLFAADIGPAG